MCLHSKWTNKRFKEWLESQPDEIILYKAVRIAEAQASDA